MLLIRVRGVRLQPGDKLVRKLGCDVALDRTRHLGEPWDRRPNPFDHVLGHVREEDNADESFFVSARGLDEGWSEVPGTDQLAQRLIVGEHRNVVGKPQQPKRCPSRDQMAARQEVLDDRCGLGNRGIGTRAPDDPRELDLRVHEFL
ncbi:unannotated protein [freshwater metagenome]|uniref:Unannotated protein n=1 Tax=freshwater metagenome TaxID=449393 RepID=A0A6J7FPN1_9ZZZZ